MVQTIQIKNLTLYDVETKFDLQPTEGEQFFREWQEDLPSLTTSEQQSLNQVRADYLYLSKLPLPENMVKMVVISPLMSLAGFYRPPFRITTEKPVKISAEDDGRTLRGWIDVLVVQGLLWVLVIESKRNTFSLEPAIPQALTYMLANPSLETTFGLVTNGSEFRFLKLTQQPTRRYAQSILFSLDRQDDLCIVLSVLKQLGQLVSQ